MGQVFGYHDPMSQLLDEIRRAIEASGLTRYQIAKETGIAQSQLSRLVNGERGLSVEAIEQLAHYLDLEIVIRHKRRKEK